MLLRGTIFSLWLFSVDPHRARAVSYELYIDVETEEDLYDLLASGQISESTFDALLSLNQTRVDLNGADRDRLYLLPNLDYADVDRIIEHREQAGRITDLDELVTAGALSAELAGSLRAFVTVVGRAMRSRRGTDGLLRLQGRWSGRYDRLPPPLAAQARVRLRGHLDIGFASTLTRNQLSHVRWDVSRRGLSAAPERVRVDVPKLYVEWEDAKWEVVVGTYRIGFGERLTFDVTDQITPNGFFGDYELRRDQALTLRCKRSAGELARSPCSNALVPYVTPDYSWTNRLTGVALGMKHLNMGGGWLQAYAWSSYQIHRVSQIEIAMTADCDDPRRDESPGCAPPPVFIRASDPGAPASEARFASLRSMYAEALAGGQVSFYWDERTHVGLIGYGSAPRWRLPDVELGFQEFAAKPFRGPFGALGVEAAFGFRAQSFFAEVARSFDREHGGGGGFGAIIRSVTTLGTAELHVSARHYDSRYVNPYARSISAADELDGLRVRDETGLRVAANARIGHRTALRVLADGWRRLSTGSLQASLFARVDLQLGSSWSWAFWSQYRSGANQRVAMATQLMHEPHERVRWSAQLAHRMSEWRADARRLQHDLAAIGGVVARPIELLRLRFRARYDLEDLADGSRSLRVLWAYLDCAFHLRTADTLRLRYDLRAFLDHRTSTIARRPNPEHWLSFEYVLRY